MRKRMFQLVFLLSCFLMCLGFAVSGFAQQGHPLTGTWNGDWGPSPTERTQITIVMTWDGKQVQSTINPGADSTSGTIALDPATWTVLIEADVKDKSGKPVHAVATGKLEDVGAYHRTIIGTWRQGSISGTFRLTRD